MFDLSSKIFNEIESRYATLKGENASLETAHNQLIKNYDSLRYHYGELVGQYEKQSQLLATTSGTLATLQDAYAALEQNSNEALQASIEKKPWSFRRDSNQRRRTFVRKNTFRFFEKRIIFSHC